MNAMLAECGEDDLERLEQMMRLFFRKQFSSGGLGIFLTFCFKNRKKRSKRKPKYTKNKLAFSNEIDYHSLYQE